MAACVGLLALAQGEIPLWTRDGSRMVTHAPLAPLGPWPLAIPARGRVLVLSDSNATAARIGGDNPWPDRFAARLGHGVQVRNLSRGGFGVGQWLEHHELPAEPADLCIIAFGSNDAAPRGWLGSRRAIDIAAYREGLLALGHKCRRLGAAVLVLAPPPTGSWAMEHRIMPYRMAAHEAARQLGASFADPVEAFAREGFARAWLGHDALHLQVEAHEAMSRWLAERVRIQPAGI